MFLASGEDDLLSAKGISNITTQKIAELLNVNIYIEKPHPSLPGVIVGELGGPVYDLCSLISSTLNEAGKILVDFGYPDLGGFVREAVADAGKLNSIAKPGVDLDLILERVRKFHRTRDPSIDSFLYS